MYSDSNTNRPDREPISNAELINRDSFERLRARNSRKTLDEWLSILLTVLVLCALLLGICTLLFFRAKNIVIEGGSYYDSSVILSQTGIDGEDNLFFIDREELENRLTLRFPYIESISLSRVLPTTLIIQVKEDTPAYVTEIRGEYFLLSRSLRVLARAKTEQDAIGYLSGIKRISLPTVTYAVTGRRLGFERDSTYSYLLDFLKVLNESEYADGVTRIDASSKFRIGVYLYEGKYKVIFGSAEEAEEKLLFFTNIRKQKLPENACAIVDVSDLKRAFVSIREEKIE